MLATTTRNCIETTVEESDPGNYAKSSSNLQGIVRGTGDKIAVERRQVDMAGSW